MKKERNTVRSTLNEWFELSKSERNGITILCTFVVLMIVFNHTAHLLHPAKTEGNIELTEELRTWMASHKNSSNSDSLSDFTSLLISKSEETRQEYFLFNPNTATVDEFLRLGFTERQIQTIRNYQSKGGSFKTKKDFSKMYFMTEARYTELESFINLPERFEYPDKKTTQYSNVYETRYSETPIVRTSFDYSQLLVEINSADTTELKKIRGIGSFTAKNIVRFRENLGGFVSVEQLVDVYPLTSEKLDSMRMNLTVDSGLIRKIKLNEATVEELSKHPYLSRSQARSLIAYRDMHGAYSGVEEIRKSALIDENTFQKIKNYLSVD